MADTSSFIASVPSPDKHSGSGELLENKARHAKCDQWLSPSAHYRNSEDGKESRDKQKDSMEERNAEEAYLRTVESSRGSKPRGCRLKDGGKKSRQGSSEGEANGGVIKGPVIHYERAASQKHRGGCARQGSSPDGSLFPAQQIWKKDGRLATPRQLSPLEIENYGPLHKTPPLSSPGLSGLLEFRSSSSFVRRAEDLASGTHLRPCVGIRRLRTPTELLHDPEGARVPGCLCAAVGEG